MIQNIFKKFKNNFPKKSNLNSQDNSKPNNLKKVNKEQKNKEQILKIDGNQYDINSLDKDSKNIIELYEISNMKIQFFENLLKQLKLNRNLKIIELKSKLKKENPLM
jgi:hypothetical protein